MSELRTSRLTVTQAVALAAALVLAASGLSACAGRSNSLGTNAGACYRALPRAEAALHSKGHLVGVRRVSTDALQDGLRSPSLSTLPPQSLCVFAFGGSFAPGAVTGATNTAPGRYAIVCVGSRHVQVVAAFVVDRLPTRFRHLH